MENKNQNINDGREETGNQQFSASPPDMDAQYVHQPQTQSVNNKGSLGNNQFYAEQSANVPQNKSGAKATVKSKRWLVIGVVAGVLVLGGIGVAISLIFSKNNVAFSDPAFNDCVAKAYDEHNKNPEGTTTDAKKLNDEQLNTIRYLRCDKAKYDNEKINNINGIEKLTSLRSLSVIRHKIFEVDLTKNTALERVDLKDNNLSNIDVSHNTELTELEVGTNPITSIDVSKNTKLTKIDVSGCKLAEVNLSNNPDLKYVYIRDNGLTELDVSQKSNLLFLNASGNNLTSVNVDGDTALESLSLASNKLNAVKLQDKPKLKQISIESNLISEVDVSQSPGLTSLTADDIMVRADIPLASETRDAKVFDLSNVKFVGETNYDDERLYSNAILDAPNYKFDNNTKMLYVSNLSGTNSYVQVTSTNKRAKYKLVLPQ